MPKSKRDKKISLTRVEKKKGLETKAALVDKVRSAVDNYARVLAKALGNSEEEEYSDNLHLVSRCLKNECGLLATNQSHEDVMEYFSNLSEPDFARTGGTATDTVELKQGPLALFSHSMEPQLRKLGMPVELVKGQVMLLADWRVCSEGEVLTSEQARILKLLGHQHAQFRLNIVSGWSKEGGNFQLYKQIEMRGQGGGGSGGEAEDSDGEELEED